MNNPERLREITDNVLYGLTADESLKNRIIQKASVKQKKDSRPFFLPVPALCGIVALLVLTMGVLNNLRPVDPASSVEMKVFTAGSVDISPAPDSFFSDILPDLNYENVLSVELTECGVVNDPEECAELIAALQECETSSDVVSEDSGRQLIIHCSNGTVYRFSVNEPYLVGDQCWICDSFFTLFHRFSDD